MGCCGSKERHDEGVHAPLLHKRPTYSEPVAPIDTKKEQEFWDQVVHRTTQNLIDISSAPNEPLQHQDIQARTQRYQALTDQVIISPVSFSAPTEVSLPSPGSPPPSWLDQAMLDLHHALAQFRVEPSGALVIPLGTR